MSLYEGEYQPDFKYGDSLKLERQPTLERQTSALDPVKKEEPGVAAEVAVKAEVKPELGVKSIFGGGNFSSEWARQKYTADWKARLQESLDSSPNASLLQRDITSYLAGLSLGLDTSA